MAKGREDEPDGRNLGEENHFADPSAMPLWMDHPMTKRFHWDSRLAGAAGEGPARPAETTWKAEQSPSASRRPRRSTTTHHPQERNDFRRCQNNAGTPHMAKESVLPSATRKVRGREGRSQIVSDFGLGDGSRTGFAGRRPPKVRAIRRRGRTRGWRSDRLRGRKARARAAMPRVPRREGF